MPLRLRNRLAGTILAALGDEGARRELTALAAGDSALGWLEPGESQWADALSERARRAAGALAEQPVLAPEADLGQALQAGAVLFDAGLHFEVHEVLEPHWAAATGSTREALQGLIQIAVGYQHLANGNLPGARSLLVEGGGRLHGRQLRGVDLEPVARAAALAATRIAAGEPVAAPVFPRFVS